MVPQEYVIAKRVAKLVAMKERFLRRLKIEAGQLQARPEDIEEEEEYDDERADHRSTISSVVSEMQSDCGTQYSETQVTQTNNQMNDTSNDVANLASIAEAPGAGKSEEETKRWFYQQCLQVKLMCAGKGAVLTQGWLWGAILPCTWPEPVRRFEALNEEVHKCGWRHKMREAEDF